jgi:hypothetical protein
VLRLRMKSASTSIACPRRRHLCACSGRLRLRASRVRSRPYRRRSSRTSLRARRARALPEMASGAILDLAVGGPVAPADPTRIVVLPHGCLRRSRSAASRST